MSTEPLTLTYFGHACVRLEKAGQRLVLDPGGWSDLAALESADVVLITHEHPDHWQAGPLVRVLAEDPEAQVWGPASVVKDLAAAGAPRERLHVPEDGVEIRAAGFSVLPTLNDHAVIHPEVPVLGNIVYVVEGSVLHPGDSLSVVPDGIDVALLPLSGPWSKASETVDYARRVAAARTVPIHDAILSEIGRGLYDKLISGMLPEESDYLRLAIGESLTIE